MIVLLAFSPDEMPPTSKDVKLARRLYGQGFLSLRRTRAELEKRGVAVSHGWLVKHLGDILRPKTTAGRLAAPHRQDIAETKARARTVRVKVGAMYLRGATYREITSTLGIGETPLRRHLKRLNLSRTRGRGLSS